MNEPHAVLLYQSATFNKKSRKHNSSGGGYVCSPRYCNEISFRLLYLVNDSLECVRVVDCEVSEDLAVDLDTSLVKEPHEL